MTLFFLFHLCAVFIAAFFINWVLTGEQVLLAYLSYLTFMMMSHCISTLYLILLGLSSVFGFYDMFGTTTGGAFLLYLLINVFQCVGLYYISPMFYKFYRAHKDGSKRATLIESESESSEDSSESSEDSDQEQQRDYADKQVDKKIDGMLGGLAKVVDER
eukprot:CAMPEP_0202959072 /NCGR_PEP_ID=MMETSP1396-20130829/3355_1 /ASSEMBLY_ACC=CAM_ASM_000872 /TAXON_ID= /ORGANISM="Pseudokeronopsis sp., Strain Brazil" /LENGTH=159 /DNA_ID=CAMNT_0049677487 /DNA_START=107 /DNA_END=586 /DNA_ORIENTATION=-